MGKKSTPPPPDYGPLIDASKEMAAESRELAREQLAWAKERDQTNQALLERVLGVQLPIMQQTFEDAQKDRTRYEQVFQPIEDKLIKEFEEYGSPARMQVERGRAIADVNASFDAQRRNALQRLESYGIDPSQTRNQALDVGVRTAQAAASAAAADQATQRVENVGRALRAEAINIGRGLPSQVAGSYGQAIGAGAAGIQGANQTANTGAALRTSGQGFTSQAFQGINQAGSLMNQGFQNAMDISRFNQASTGQWLDVAGTLGGAALGGMQEGGIVPEEGALPVSPIPGSTDRKPALLTPGEAVVDKDTVQWYGEKYFHDLKRKAGEQRQAIEIEKRRVSPQAIPAGAAAAIPVRG